MASQTEENPRPTDDGQLVSSKLHHSDIKLAFVHRKFDDQDQAQSYCFHLQQRLSVVL